MMTRVEFLLAEIFEDWDELEEASQEIDFDYDDLSVEEKAEYDTMLKQMMSRGPQCSHQEEEEDDSYYDEGAY